MLLVSRRSRHNTTLLRGDSCSHIPIGPVNGSSLNPPDYESRSSNCFSSHLAHAHDQLAHSRVPVAAQRIRSVHHKCVLCRHHLFFMRHENRMALLASKESRCRNCRPGYRAAMKSVGWGAGMRNHRKRLGHTKSLFDCAAAASMSRGSASDVRRRMSRGSSQEAGAGGRSPARLLQQGGHQERRVGGGVEKNIVTS